MAGKIIIDTERCKGCGLCVAVCPKGCIFIAKSSNKTGYFPAQTSNSECTGCAMCAIVCPEAIIEVYRGSPDRVEVVAKPGGENAETSFSRDLSSNPVGERQSKK